MHHAIKTVIVDANRELQTDNIPELATTHSVPDAPISPVVPVAKIDEEIPAPPSTFGNLNSSAVLSFCIKLYLFAHLCLISNLNLNHTVEFPE